MLIQDHGLSEPKPEVVLDQQDSLNLQEPDQLSSSENVQTVLQTFSVEEPGAVRSW